MTEHEDKLAEALLPFAALLQPHHANMPDDRPIYGIDRAQITAGDLRRAVEALTDYNAARAQPASVGDGWQDLRKQYVHMMATMAERFTSGNSVPVERAHMRREEWELWQRYDEADEELSASMAFELTHPSEDARCPYVVTGKEGASHCKLAEQDARDAARYHELRNNGYLLIANGDLLDKNEIMFAGDELDAAIDAAMKGDDDAV